MESTAAKSFKDANRVIVSVLAPAERRTLQFLAARMPARVNSDHLTALALAAMLGAGLSFWLARFSPVGFVLVVIPYMFYDAFFPDPNTQVPWVRDAKTLPYIKGTGDSIRYILEAYMPSSLTAPPGEQPQEEQPVQPQQQGALENPRGDELALEAAVRYHISVTWQVRAS